MFLSKTPGVRMFRFDYGCNIRRWVFREMTLSNETLIIDCISEAILYYEPRIEVEHISLDTADMTEGILRINIDYRVRETNSRSNIVYPYYFMEGTNI